MIDERKENKTLLHYDKREPGGSEPVVSDQDLIAQAQRADPQAMTVLYLRYRVRILNYLVRFTGNRMVAEDLVQETFLRVVRHIASYQPTGSAAGWIYRIAKNLALNHLRDRKSDPELSLDEPVLYGQEEALDRSEAIPGPDPGPGEEASRGEIADTVQQALLQIAAPYREALILCDIQECPYREAAEILRCSINTVASRLARGRTQLARLLGYLKEEAR